MFRVVLILAMSLLMVGTCFSQKSFEFRANTVIVDNQESLVSVKINADFQKGVLVTTIDGDVDIYSIKDYVMMPDSGYQVLLIIIDSGEMLKLILDLDTGKSLFKIKDIRSPGLSQIVF